MKELTPQQKLAATATGSAAVTAGAGTGKTLMLAERYLHHVITDRLSPLAVVAVTFTEKAADELRVRIRRRLRDGVADDAIIAEVEAAQISTIHALCARICRDFYDLAGIPADFAVLDETQMPLWMAEKFDEAVAGIDDETVGTLGFTWMVGALRDLLRNPAASRDALSLGSTRWRDSIEKASEDAIADLVSGEAWLEACETLPDCCGASGDKLEDKRSAVHSALTNPDQRGGILSLKGLFVGYKEVTGNKKNWPQDVLSRTRACMWALRNLIREKADFALLEWGPHDDEAERRLPLLQGAFEKVTAHLASEKLAEKVLDFDDLEHYALKVLEHDAVREHYRRRWRAFLVDEFQDTNSVQAAIVERLTRDAAVTIVGDEKQSIYGFRGADVEVFADVRTRLISTRGGIEVPLTTTFRSHAELVTGTNAIFEVVLEDLHQELEADKDNEAKVAGPFVRAAAVEAETGTGKYPSQVVEARWIAERIVELNRSGVAYKDIAILARRWAPLDVYLGMLSAYNIPAMNVGGGNLLETREVKDVYTLMSFLAEPEDDVPLIALLRGPFFAVSDRLLQETATRRKGSWWSTVQKESAFSDIFETLRALIDASERRSANEVLTLADELTGFNAVVANLPYGGRREADLSGVRDLFRQFEQRGRGDVFGTARSLRELITAGTLVGRPPLDAADAVTLVSIHRAKGLEWPVVFVADLATENIGGFIPIYVDRSIGVAFRMSGDNYEWNEPAIYKLLKLRRKKRETEESKRLMYVAITRAEQQVFLTGHKADYGEMKMLTPGLAAAGVEIEKIVYEPHLAVAPSPGEAPSFDLPDQMDLAAIPRVLTDLPVTALTAYAKCPKQFEYQYVLGHPGYGEGFARAMAVGWLTHKALELDISDVERLRLISPETSDDVLNEALDLADRFHNVAAFAEFRGGESEVRFATEISGLRFNGIADLVGEDFVLDFKTDTEMHADEHRFQLWAYQKSLGKPRAVIAYLRHGATYEWTAVELNAVEDEGLKLIERIKSGDYIATPSIEECSRCAYNAICPFSAVGSPEPTAPAPDSSEPVQLGFAF